jgi:pyridoxamine 5'-phosphate oxidase-like protein
MLKVGSLAVQELRKEGESVNAANEVNGRDREESACRLLPLSNDPYRGPVDRDMLPSERRLFVRTHRTCIFGYGRQSDGPAMSVVYYVPAENGDLLVATMADRAKAKAVARSGKVSLCVLDEAWPFAYLQIYCDAEIDPDAEMLVDVMMAIAERMSGEALGAELRPMVKAMGEEEGRVLVRCRPYATFVTPPRHLHRNDQEERLTHWVSASMAWDAVDTPAEGSPSQF